MRLNAVRVRRVHLGKAKWLGWERPFTKGTTATTREKKNHTDLACSWLICNVWRSNQQETRHSKYNESTRISDSILSYSVENLKLKSWGDDYDSHPSLSKKWADAPRPSPMIYAMHWAVDKSKVTSFTFVGGNADNVKDIFKEYWIFTLDLVAGNLEQCSTNWTTKAVVEGSGASSVFV